MKNQVLRYVAIALLSFGSLVAGWVLAVGVAVNPGGITFPDGTVQTTAAAQLVLPEAWAQQCIHLGPISASQTLSMRCVCHLDDPCPEWDSTNGVPEGLWFLVTDVHIDPVGSADTDYAVLDVGHRIGINVFNSYRFRLNPAANTRVFSFRAPIFRLAEGHFLEVSHVEGNVSAQVGIVGYLTSSPELILH